MLKSTVQVIKLYLFSIFLDKDYKVLHNNTQQINTTIKTQQ